MAIRTEGHIAIDRLASDVFDYLAHAEHLPDYIDDFERVTHEQDGPPGQGHVYSYKMKRGAEGTFEWTEFRPHDKLAWRGPAVKQGPFSMQPSGWWELAEHDGHTHVTLMMTPEPGGLLKLMAPLMRRGMARGNERALEKLKGILEGGAG
jgi:Polyketide cyclase / dehydrase and lipid transport